MNAVTALGYAAYVPVPAAAGSGRAAALDYLMKGRFIGTWQGLIHWRLPNGADPSSRLRLRSIAGLGLSGDHTALGALQTLPPPAGGRGGGAGWNAAASEQASIDEAIRTNTYIAANGMSKYYETFLIR
jgi:hypothetical protein